MTKKLLFGFCLIVFIFVCINLPVIAGKPIEGIDFIKTDNYANTQLEFYYYIPSEIIKNKQKAYPVLVCVPGLSGRGENFVTSVFKEFANKERFVIIAPSFVWDKANWSARKSYQYPSVWSGDASIKIIEKVKKKYGLHIFKLYLYGFSAGAQFSLRFALLKPELCIGCAAHAPGGTVIPERKVPVKFFIAVGTKDITRVPKVDTFYYYAKKLGINVIYKKYEGGHSLTSEQITDSLKFFKDIRNPLNTKEVTKVSGQLNLNWGLIVIFIIAIILTGFISYKKGFQTGINYIAEKDSTQSKVWTSKKWKYQITFPWDWNPIKRYDPSIKTSDVDVFCSNNLGFSTAVFAYRKPSDTSLDRVSSDVLENFKKMGADIKVISKEDYKKNNALYRKIIFQREESTHYYTIVLGSKIMLIISSAAPTKDFETAKKDFNSVVDSVIFLDQK